MEEWLERQRDYDNFGFNVINEEDDNLNNTAFAVIDDEFDKKDEASGGDEVDKKDEASGGDDIAEYIVPFNIVEKQILEKYKFDPTFNIPPTEGDVRSKISSANGKMRSKDNKIKQASKFESNTLSSYLRELKIAKRIKNLEETRKKLLNKDNKTGEGIRKYKQPKRQAYKISRDGMYGGLFINYPKLINEYKVEALKGGQIVYDNKGDKSLVELLTKRFNPKKRYSCRAVQIFNDLNMLSGIPKHKSSGKSTLGDTIYFIKPEDMIKKLKLLVGARIAGNNNIQQRNEIWEIIDKLVDLGKMTSKQHDEIVKKYLM